MFYLDILDDEKIGNLYRVIMPVWKRETENYIHNDDKKYKIFIELILPIAETYSYSSDKVYFFHRKRPFSDKRSNRT